MPKCRPKRKILTPETLSFLQALSGMASLAALHTTNVNGADLSRAPPPAETVGTISTALGASSDPASGSASSASTLAGKAVPGASVVEVEGSSHGDEQAASTCAALDGSEQTATSGSTLNAESSTEDEEVAEPRSVSLWVSDLLPRRV